MMWASEVLPSPGGPASSTWSSDSSRRRAASMNTASWPVDLLLVDEVGERRGRSERSSSSSVPRAAPRPSARRPLGPRSPIPGVAGDAHEPPPGPGASQGRPDQLLGGLAARPARAGPRPRPRCSRGSTRPSRARARGSSSPAALAVVATSLSSPATFSRSSTISRSEVRLPTPGTAWKRFASPAAIAGAARAAARRRGSRPRPWARSRRPR